MESGEWEGLARRGAECTVVRGNAEGREGWFFADATKSSLGSGVCFAKGIER